MAKMFDRLLLFVFSLLISIIAVIVLFAGFKLIPVQDAMDFVHNVYRYPVDRYVVISACILVIIACLRFVYISIRFNRNNTPSIDQRTEYGDIRISIETMENLALKAAARIRGVRDLKARVNVNESGLEITIRMLVDGEISIPVMTEEVQRTVKDHIEEITGIPVANVSVFVANVTQSTSFKSRVE